MFFYRLVRPQNQGLALKYSSILESSGISIALDLAGPHPAKFVAKYYATNQIGPILPREFFFFITLVDTEVLTVIWQCVLCC